MNLVSSSAVSSGLKMQFALALHRALTPLPSPACEPRTKRASSLSRTNNPQQTSWASSLFCGKGCAVSDPVALAAARAAWRPWDLLCWWSLHPPAPRPHSLGSRSPALAACSRWRQTLGRNDSKRRQARHAALGPSLVHRSRRVCRVFHCLFCGCPVWKAALRGTQRRCRPGLAEGSSWGARGARSAGRLQQQR